MIFFCWRSSASNPSEKKYLSEISKDNTNVKVVATSLDENNVAYETAVKQLPYITHSTNLKNGPARH